MKLSKKALFFVIAFSSCGLNAIGLPFAFRAAVFTISRAVSLAKTLRPAAKQACTALQKSEVAQAALRAAEPSFVRAEAWALEHPDAASGGIIGGLVGWETSGEGVVNTVSGIATGALAGAFLGGYKNARLAHETVLAELQAARTELQAAHRANRNLLGKVCAGKEQCTKAKESNVQAALAALKPAGQPVTQTSAQGSMTNSLTTRAAQLSVRAKNAIQAVFGAPLY